MRITQYVIEWRREGSTDEWAPAGGVSNDLEQLRRVITVRRNGALRGKEARVMQRTKTITYSKWEPVP